MGISLFLNENTLLTVFLIAFLGYLLGSVKIKGISFGTAGVLIVALILGHFGVVVPSFVQNLGLVCFVTAVGFIAGPNFFRNFTSNAKSYVSLGLIIVGTGAVACVFTITVLHVDADLALGLLAGALTTTPGLAAAIEATGSNVVSLGYGIAYPFGVISVVLFVQIMPKILHADIAEERRKFLSANHRDVPGSQVKMFRFGSGGFFGFSLAAVTGILLGKITIPLPGGVSFALGTSGGPLLTGLILGHFGHIGKVNVSAKNEVLVTMREFGLIMFLIGAGTNAGAGFLEVLAEQGVLLFLYGAAMALLPVLVGFVIAQKVFCLSIFDMLGSICGGMTSTPALGTLIEVAGTDDVASSYAATYPVALAFVVLLSQLIGVIWG